MLVFIPEEPLYPQEFLNLNQKHRVVIGNELEMKSYNVESAVVELINTFMDTITEPSFQDQKYNWMDPELAVQPVGSLSKLNTEDELIFFKPVDRQEKMNLTIIHMECLDMFAFFNSKMIEALYKSMKMSLEELKKRVTASSIYIQSLSMYPPLIKTDMELHIPNAVICPDLDEIQTYLIQIMNNTLEVMKFVTIWAQRNLKPTGNCDVLDFDPFEGKSKYHRSSNFQTVDFT